ncbi:Ger(x)C family spore germination protein [Desulfuribacillus alkaliarsenatis]|uniref:Uncharacterized protein n=1 Tax=Desulfuribacillus alkaliarsenatis TaxID=766136 RepID=A0A1E5FYI1_9FIRM|nr:Ger(x)C family spore germination protein [Desulfuribacillus alkaliarsenatis]OEF95633.1 hypothetical protein BHF68_12375 [Desulfuribacillus alkaliarsenatis]
MIKLIAVKKLIIVCMVILLTGCWNYKDIDELGIITGLAIDEGENKNYLITVKIVIPKEQEEMDPESKILEMEGETIFDSVRNMIMIFPKKLYFPHMDIVIISEKVAEKGIVHTLDFLMRDAEPRISTKVLIAKDSTASKILKHERIFTGIHSYEIESMLESQSNLAKAPKVSFHQLINNIVSEGISATLPVIQTEHFNKRDFSIIQGTAIFKQDILVGYLDENQTKTFLFITDQIDGGLIIIENIEGQADTNIALEILETGTKLTPEYNGQLEIQIDVSGQVALAEVSREYREIDEEMLEAVKREANKKLEQDIVDLIKMIQADYGADVFGFGNLVKTKNHKVWRDIENWEEEFRNLSVNVEVDLEIINTALSKKSIQVGD